MRRGRPTKSDRLSTQSPVVENSVPVTKSFDPFDPSHVNKASPPIAVATAASTTTTTNTTTTTPTTTLPASFQNSFIPEPTISSTSTSSATSPPPRVQSAPITQHVTPKPQMATKILQTQPNSPVTKSTKEDVKNATDENKSNIVENKNEYDEDGDDDNNDDDDNDDDVMPKMNRGVSSSIEARFMAIKNASRSGAAHPVKPTTTTSTPKKNKPAPPPKPARFRLQQTNQQVPSVDDFEHKFPSLEDLDKSIS